MAGGKKNDVRHRPTAQKTESPQRSFGYDYSKDYSDKSWPYHHGKLDRGAKLILIVFPITIISGIAYVWYSSTVRARLYTPLDQPKVVPTVDAMSAESNALRYWGSYKSGLYFGMKTRHPDATSVGLMWTSKVSVPGHGWSPIRHWCEQGDQLATYGWRAHDGVNFGVQQIVDRQMIIATSFIKQPGGQHGGDWTAKIIAEPHGKEDVFTSFFIYVAIGQSGHLDAAVSKDHQMSSISGNAADVGAFRLNFKAVSQGADVKYSHIMGSVVGLERLKEIVERNLRQQYWKKFNTDYLSLPASRLRMNSDSDLESQKYAVYQVTGKLPLMLEVVFESGSVVNRPTPLVGQVFDDEIKSRLATFDGKFEQTFGLRQKGYSDFEIDFAKATFSNLLGGVTYMHGSSLVKSKHTAADETVTYFEAPLYTAVPSRSFFPRGFLWDEGFHNLLIGAWDTTISLDIIAHWLDLMNAEGWIPREQILGSEARARVPSQFVVQHNEVANPPAMFFPLRRLVNAFSHDTDAQAKAVFKAMFGRLKVWYNWYNSSQAGSEFSTYRWRGRDANAKTQLNPLTLASGLDDYPRASHPTDAEYHLDLRCWMALASRVMADLAAALGEDGQVYESTYALLSDNSLLDKLHWSETAGRYADFGLHTDGVKLIRPQPAVPPRPGQPPPPPRDKERAVTKEPRLQLVDGVFGYASLMPLIVRLIKPDSLKLGKILNDLQEPNLLWSPYGLRSLAKSSPLYHKHNTEHDPPYWRGAVWINFNYLCLDALHHYGEISGPFQDKARQVYAELRRNVVNNVIAQYNRTGYVWENYDDTNGHGKGSHPFTGWSGLVVSIMAENF